VFAGFVWINMDPECISLKKFLGPIWDEWAAYPMDQLTRTQAISVRMPCNWKTVQDNFHETYHVATAHPLGLNNVEDDYRLTAITMFEGGHALGVTQGSILARRKFGDNPSLGEQICMELQAWALNPEDFRGREYETRIALQKQKRQLGPERGASHYNKMSDAQLTDVFHYTVFPNFATSLNSDGMLYLRALPHPSDPELCVFDCWFYAVGTENAYARLMTEKGGGADKHAGPAPREWRNYGEGTLGIILDGDAVVMADQQRALHSRGYKGSRLANQERRIQQYHDMIDRYMDGYRPR
jgi:phenylpropionate dioxygenase-like ring-hydroxylating dioxygenase large terminal subunit